jgi:hypothetical protein
VTLLLLGHGRVLSLHACGGTFVVGAGRHSLGAMRWVRGAARQMLEGARMVGYALSDVVLHDCGMCPEWADEARGWEEKEK